MGSLTSVQGTSCEQRSSLGLNSGERRNSTELYCTVPYSILLSCTVQQHDPGHVKEGKVVSPKFIVGPCTILHYTEQYCTVELMTFSFSLRTET